MSDAWLTPPEILRELAPFDLDPCAHVGQPYPTAGLHYTVHDDGLSQPWSGFVWCNPPFSSIGPWADRMACHANGILLVPASTGAKYWQDRIFPHAAAVHFVRGRIKFLDARGRPGKFNSGFSVALVGFGREAKRRLRVARIPGALVELP